MVDTKKEWGILKLYLIIASLVWLIWGLISLGIALTSLWKRVIITNEEYVRWRWRWHYELQQCKEQYFYGKTAPKDENRRPSEEQIKECEKTQTENIVFTRRIDVKETVLGWGIRAILFAILFFTHYPKFKKENK